MELYDDQPTVALWKLREVLVSGRGGSDELYAIAELTYLYAENHQSRPYALAAALYAYAYLFPDDADERPVAVDPRYRWACDIYAEGLTQAFRDPGAKAVQLSAGTYELPFGTITLDFDREELVWSSRTFVELVPVSEYEIYGLRNRYRQPGIGVSLAAKTEALGEGAPADMLVDDRIRVPTTLVLRF